MPVRIIEISSERVRFWANGDEHLLAPMLALQTLAAGLGARREGLRIAGALLAATLALLVCCAALWALSAGWLGTSLCLTILQLALVVLAMSLGWAMLSRMMELRKDTEIAQGAQLAVVANQAHTLEAMVAQRNAELSARLRELSEARQSSELANQSLQRALDQLEQVASTDRLTGAWNRRRFEEAVLPEIALAHRRRDPLSLLMFDLDHFKRVNDTFGHGAGDAVLAGTAQTVRMHLRASDSLVRWGGEEFLVMTPATRLEGAMGLAEKLRAAVEAVDFPDVGHVTMSLGVSEYAIGEGLEEWIERTDQALYRAKAEGRNRARPPSSPAESPPRSAPCWRSSGRTPTRAAMPWSIPSTSASSASPARSWRPSRSTARWPRSRCAWRPSSPTRPSTSTTRRPSCARPGTPTCPNMPAFMAASSPRPGSCRRRSRPASWTSAAWSPSWPWIW